MLRFGVSNGVMFNAVIQALRAGERATYAPLSGRFFVSSEKGTLRRI